MLAEAALQAAAAVASMARVAEARMPEATLLDRAVAVVVLPVAAEAPRLPTLK